MISLHDYQQDIVARLFEAWRRYRSVMVQMPTGTGKTHVLAAVVKSLTPGPSPRERGVDTISGCNGDYDCNYVDNHKNEKKHITPLSLGEGAGERPVWIVAHRRELVAQIEAAIQKMYTKASPKGNTVSADFKSAEAEAAEADPSLFVLPSSLKSPLPSSLKENSSLFILNSSFIRVLSIQWLSRHWDDVECEPSLIVIDEAHHARAKTYKELWKRCPQAKFLGLTATPCRMNRSGFTDLFDTLITSWSVAEFIEKKYLSAFDYVSIRQGSEEQRQIDSLEKRGADGDYQVREMNRLLNRDTNIGRLYRSVEKYARGKKGIVYAIGIEHARSIAEYYNSKGIGTAVIDSRTPAEERRRIVEEFRRSPGSLPGVRLPGGRLSVLVNVDVFSEGFDCPDVEFIQLARPTLSLAKYLQQVGRGLRRSAGKEACVIIDNVGLYRVFGLPTVAWDWQAMFRGHMAGKAMAHAASMGNYSAMTAFREEPAAGQENDMEVIVSHEQLLTDIGNLNKVCPMQTGKCELKAWQDSDSGLWGLRRGRNRTVEAVFITVFDIRYGMAAVRFRDMDCGIVNDAGDVIWKKNGCFRVMFIKDKLLYVKSSNGEYYVDIYNLHAYVRKPKVRKYGNIELLETDGVYYSRTKTIYVNSQGISKHFIHGYKFYLTIYDEKVPFPGYHKENISSEYYTGHACILEGDNDCYYWLYYRLADGGIIVMDNARRYYHVTVGQPKKYIGCRDSEEEWDRCRAEIELMARQAEEKWGVSETERMEEHRQKLALSNDAVPFKSGVRWGLRVGSRITIPPIYRRIKSPVGKYCAVEKNYNQWGVVALDGTVMVEPQYSDIEISQQGFVMGTKITGSKERIKLP